jgi:hypothetical protein
VNFKFAQLEQQHIESLLNAAYKKFNNSAVDLTDYGFKPEKLFEPNKIFSNGWI